MSSFGSVVCAFLLALLLGSSVLAAAPSTTLDAAGNTKQTSSGAQAAADAANATVIADNAGSLSMRSIGALVNAALGGNLTGRFVAAAIGLSTNLAGYALILAGTLALASLLWNVLIAMAERKSPMDPAIEAVIFASLVVALISAYGVIVQSIVDVGQRIITNLAGGDLGSAVSSFIDSYFMKLIDVVVSGFERAASLTGWVSGAFDLIVSTFLMVIALFFGIMALIELVGVVLLGPIVLGVGIILGPLFIACLASHWTRSWFSSWINFVINGAVITAVVVIVLKLMSTVILNSNPIQGGSLVAEALTLALMSVALGKVFSNIPGMVDGLLPGRTGMKSIQGKDFVSAASSSASAAKAAPGKAVAAAKSVRDGGISAMSAGAKILRKVP